MPYRSKIALLGQIIDYAGTFPPAALSLDAALIESASHEKELKHSWLYAKMALPLSDLKTLTTKKLYDAGGQSRPWLFSALGSPLEENPTLEEALRVWEWDLREIQRFNERGWESSCRHGILAYEIKLPSVLVLNSSKIALTQMLKALFDRKSKFQRFYLDLYLEVPLVEMEESHYLNLWESIIEALDASDTHESSLGLKFRTGGKVIPTAKHLARAISNCRNGRLKFKATQGLHSTLTHGNDFGFLNLMASLSLAYKFGSESFGENKIEECLKDEDKRNFTFTPQSFQWKNFTLSNEELESARRIHAGCFGSCSLKEPDESLQKEFPE